MKFTYTGLSEQEVHDSRNQHGSNAVTTQDVETFWDKLIANLKDPIIMILIVALLVTLALAALGFAPWYEGLGIAIAVVLATLVATFSEYSNESEFQSLLMLIRVDQLSMCSEYLRELVCPLSVQAETLPGLRNRFRIVFRVI